MSQVENEGGSMKPSKFTHAISLRLVGKKVASCVPFETLALSNNTFLKHHHSFHMCLCRWLNR